MGPAEGEKMGAESARPLVPIRKLMKTAELFGMLDFSAEKLSKIGVFASERFSCDLFCFEAGQDQKAHTHPASDKVYVVLEGGGIFRVGGEEQRLAAGQAVLAPAGQEHGVSNPGRERMICLVFMAPPPEK
jgi:quercetin dioxygenase-like cupin family protein